MIRALAIFALVLAAPAEAEDTSPEAFVRALYAPYGEADPDWETVREKPMYSAATSALIDRWMAGADPDQVEDLADFDWLCQCQDWDTDAFALAIAPRGERTRDKAEVTARMELGRGDFAETRFLLVREHGEWLIDDQVSEAFPNGLKAALREAMAKQGDHD